MAARIERTLRHERQDGRQTVIRQDGILSFRDPVVILGDPGLGKTVLTRWLGERPGMKYVRAGTFVRAANPSNSVAGTERIVVDGLDEFASAAPGGAVDAVLKQLSAIGNPPFVLSCRAADWLGAADRVKIEDDYGVAPALLHLRPFTEDDARAFLSEEFPAIDSAEVLAHLARCGIESLYENPLTLRMLGEVAQDDGPLPETRAQLFDRACRVMLKETNPRHHRDSHARRSEEELLLAAGALCAAQLLCGRHGIFDGPNMETPEGYLNAVDMVALPFGGAANDALRVRLFQAEGENRFTPRPSRDRGVSRCQMARPVSFEAGVSEKRIFALFRQGEGVPTSLRGLHAWMAHFNETLARRCIEADPYAVLRYGDAETLSLDQARSLLSALKKLSEDDPYFRAEDWGRHPVSGLLRTELKDDIRAIVEPPRSHIQLTNSVARSDGRDGARRGAGRYAGLDHVRPAALCPRAIRSGRNPVRRGCPQRLGSRHPAPSRYERSGFRAARLRDAPPSRLVRPSRTHRNRHGTGVFRASLEPEVTGTQISAGQSLQWPRRLASHLMA